MPPEAKRGGLLGRGRSVFYGWWLVGISAFTLAVVIGPILQGLGAFFVALERDFGWSRLALSGAFSLARAEESAIGPAAGYLTDRLGTRRLVFIGFIILGIGFVLLSRIDTIVGFYLAFFVVTAGAGFAGFLPLMGALNHWFVRYRATAMGISQSGVSLGGLLVPALAWGITFAGWRATAFWIGVVMWLLAFPVAAVIRDRPEGYGQAPDGDPPGPTSPATGDGQHREDGEADYSLGQALRAPAFWMIALAHAFAAVVFLTLSIHAIPMITDRGVSLAMAATVVATYTTVAGGFQIIGGLIGDRVPKRIAIAVFMVIQGTGVMVAALSQNTAMVFLFAVLFGIGSGGRIPLLIAIRGDYFGRKAFATIFGFSTVPMSVVLVAGPVVTGYLSDVRGSYTVPLVGLACVSLLAAVLILLVPNRRAATPLR